LKATTNAIAARQIELFDEAIDLAAALDAMTNDTYLQIGEKLQLAIDTFKPVLRPADWWKRRSKTIADFGTRYLNARGSTPQPYKWLAVYALATASSKAEAIIRDEAAPIDSSTLFAIAETFLVYHKEDDTWTIREGFADELTPFLENTRDKAIPLATVEKELAALEFRIIDPTTEEGKELKVKAKADRSKAINAAFDRLAKTLKELRVSEAEAIAALRSREILSGSTTTYDPDTMTHFEAAPFAKRIVHLDKADVIHTMTRTFAPYIAEAEANAKRPAPPVRPELNDAPSGSAARRRPVPREALHAHHRPHRHRRLTVPSSPLAPSRDERDPIARGFALRPALATAPQPP
jgi:hypothetical protein